MLLVVRRLDLQVHRLSLDCCYSGVVLDKKIPSMLLIRECIVVGISCDPRPLCMLCIACIAIDCYLLSRLSALGGRKQGERPKSCECKMEKRAKRDTRAHEGEEDKCLVREDEVKKYGQ